MLCSVSLVLLIVSKGIATLQSWWLSIFCWVALMLTVMLAFVLAGFLSTWAFLCQVPGDRVICCSLKMLFMVAWFPIYAWLLCVPNQFTVCGGHSSKAKNCFTTWSKVLNASEAGQITVTDFSVILKWTSLLASRESRWMLWALGRRLHVMKTGKLVRNFPLLQHCWLLSGPVLQFCLG